VIVMVFAKLVKDRCAGNVGVKVYVMGPPEIVQGISILSVSMLFGLY